MSVECPACGGSGRIHSHNDICDHCDGKGKIEHTCKKPCPACFAEKLYKK